MTPETRREERCGGSGQIPAPTMTRPGRWIEGVKPCPGCDHPNCPNREPAPCTRCDGSGNDPRITIGGAEAGLCSRCNGSGVEPAPHTREEAEHPESRCQRCGGPNIVWFTDNDLWNRVIGSPNGILCPICFARSHGDATWRLSVEPASQPVPDEGEHDCGIVGPHERDEYCPAPDTPSEGRRRCDDCPYPNREVCPMECVKQLGDRLDAAQERADRYERALKRAEEAISNMLRAAIPSERIRAELQQLSRARNEARTALNRKDERDGTG